MTHVHDIETGKLTKFKENIGRGLSDKDRAKRSGGRSMSDRDRAQELGLTPRSGAGQKGRSMSDRDRVKKARALAGKRGRALSDKDIENIKRQGKK
jgi:hypothetical protein